MNFLDLILLTPIVFGLGRGLYKGLINELASLISLALGVFLAYQYSDLLFQLLSQYIDEAGKGIMLLSYALIFIASSILVLLIAKALTKLLKLVALGLMNRILGGIFGALKFLLILLILIHISHPFLESQGFYEKESFVSSSFYSQFLEMSKIIGVYSQEIPEIPDENSLGI